jgi:hypothetical protein
MSLPLRWEPNEAPGAPYVLPSRPLRRRVSRRSRALRALVRLMACLGVGSLAVVGAGSVLHSVHPAPTLKLVLSASQQGRVVLDTASVDRRLGFVTITGSVSSHTSRPLSKVEAVVELLDAANRPVQVESGLIAFDPLLPGQASPFRVEVNDNTQAVTYRVRFKELLGPALN